MTVRDITKLVALLTMCSVVCSCGGGDSAGGGVAEMKTVFVGAPQVTSAATLLSDIAKWSKDTNLDSKIEICGLDDPQTVNDDATISLTVTKYASAPKGSAVRIGNGVVTFSPAETGTPALPAAYATLPVTIGQTIPEGGGTLSFPVPLVTHQFKDALVYGDNVAGVAAIVCTGKIYRYYATISLDLVEVDTNVKKTVSTQMTVVLADFAD
jgi:hypothetical protein